MKKITKILFIALLGILFAACESDINKVYISSDPTSPSVDDLSFSGDFAMTNADGLITFSWTAADFGFKSSTTYGVECSPTSDFSSNVKTLLTTQDLTGSAKVSDVNGLLLSWDKTIGEATTIYYRVYATVSASETVYSGVKSKDFTPFETLVDYPMIYVPGAYQGWAPGDENGRLFSYNFDSKYEGILRLVDTDTTTTSVEFKITPAANWDNDWGGSLTKSGDNYSGTLVAKGDNLKVDEGTYKIEADISALTINLTKTNDWGIIGSAVPPYDWSVDVNMFYNGQRKMWEITADFKAGELKFRADDGWDLNYGGADGALSAGGANIVLDSDGNYTIRFDPVALTYTVQQN